MPTAWLRLSQVGHSEVAGLLTMNSALNVSSTLVIRGPAGGVTIARDTNVPFLRPFRVASGSDLTIENLSLERGESLRGGAILNFGVLTVTASHFSNCVANAATLPDFARGGAIHNNGTLTVTNSTFTGNSALITGGAIYNATGTMTVTGSHFSNCGAFVSGGAIFNKDLGGLSSVSSSTFQSNVVVGVLQTAEALDGYGGGAICNRGALAVRDSTFDGNVAESGFNGGAIDNSGDLTVSGSTFVRNVVNHATVQAFGGAIENRGVANITNSTFTQNRAVFGTAIHGGSGTSIIHCTIVDQQVATTSGAAVQLQGVGTITNSIICRNFWFSASNNTTFLSNVSGDFSGTNNLIDNPSPGLAPLGNYGGPTQTMPILSNSPARDAGIAISGVTTDQRGVTRPQGPAPDIGAFEIGGPPVINSANAASFISRTTNRFQVTTFGELRATFSVSGALPAGVTLSPSGLLSGTPQAGTVGTYPLVLTATDQSGQSGTQQFTLTVTATELLVTTAADEDNGALDPALGTGTSLREAFNRATQLGGATTIYFDSSLAGQTIHLSTVASFIDGASAFRVTSNVTIQGLTGHGGITLARGTSSDLRAFLISSGSLTLNDLTLAGFRASGGGAILGYAHLNMNRCTVRDNSGDGIFFFPSGGATIENSTIVNNWGGPAIRNNPPLSLRHVTMTGNTGGGMAPSANRSTVINSIIAGNTSNGNPSDAQALLNTSTSVNNIFGIGGSGGLSNGSNGNVVGVQTAQLRLGPLTNNGGPTQTMALLAGSPALNGATTLLAIDQRGTNRSNGGVPDIGAFESVPSTVVTTTQDENDGTSEPSAGTGTSLREALLAAAQLGGPQTITFAPGLSGQTVLLSDGWQNSGDTSALRVNGQITIQGPTTGNGVTIAIAPGVARRHLLIENGASLTLSHLTISGGNPPSGDDRGGAISSYGNLTVRHCTFAGNTGSEGGAIQNWSGGFVVENTTFAANTATIRGSAISCNGPAATFRHLTLTGNTDPEGALVLWTTQLTMINSIIAGNSNESIWVGSGGGFTTTSSHNIFAAATAAGLTHNLNGNQLGVSPAQLRLGPLADNGGPNPTVALLPNSAAINAGIPLTGISTDQRGVARETSSGLRGRYYWIPTGVSPDLLAPLGTLEALTPVATALTPRVDFGIGTESVPGDGSVLDRDGSEGNIFGGIGIDIPTENIAAIWDGFITIPETATYRFTTRSDDGSVVFINGGLVVDNNFFQAPVNRSGTILLPAGFHHIQVGYYEGSVGATMQLSWENLDGPSPFARQIIPAEVFSAGPTGLGPAPDIGAFEFMPVAAAAPVVSPNAGTYQTPQTVSLTTTADGAEIRYTTDGSTPTASEGILYTGPFVLESNTTVRAIAAGGGWLPSAVTSATFTIQTSLDVWRALHGLAADGSQDLANPSGDGINNLLKYAFNLAPNAGDLPVPNLAILSDGATSGLPRITRNAEGRLVIEFIRRKSSGRPGITYVVETGDDLGDLQALDLDGATYTSIDDNWERVTAIDPTITPKRFGRVRVQVADGSASGAP